MSCMRHGIYFSLDKEESHQSIDCFWLVMFSTADHRDRLESSQHAWFCRVKINFVKRNHFGATGFQEGLVYFMSRELLHRESPCC